MNFTERTGDFACIEGQAQSRGMKTGRDQAKRPLQIPAYHA